MPFVDQGAYLEILRTIKNLIFSNDESSRKDIFLKNLGHWTFVPN